MSNTAELPEDAEAEDKFKVIRAIYNDKELTIGDTDFKMTKVSFKNQLRVFAWFTHSAGVFESGRLSTLYADGFKDIRKIVEDSFLVDNLQISKKPKFWNRKPYSGIFLKFISNAMGAMSFPLLSGADEADKMSQSEIEAIQEEGIMTLDGIDYEFSSITRETGMDIEKTLKVADFMAMNEKLYQRGDFIFMDSPMFNSVMRIIEKDVLVSGRPLADIVDYWSDVDKARHYIKFFVLASQVISLALKDEGSGG